jgi:hypothetical protein
MEVVGEKRIRFRMPAVTVPQDSRVRKKFLKNHVFPVNVDFSWRLWQLRDVG